MHGVVRQQVEREPVDLGAFVGSGVDRLTAPGGIGLGGGEQPEPDVPFGVAVVDGADRSQGGGVEPDADFLAVSRRMAATACSPGRLRCYQRPPPFHFTCRHK
jgi:hypothetical protein